MTSQKVPFQIVVDALLDETRLFPARYNHFFSDISPGQLKLLLDAWPRIPIERQRALLEDLEALAEEDTLLTFDDLARALLTDPDPKVRSQSIRLLWNSEDVKLAMKFLDMLRNDNDANVRAAAATALGGFVYQGEIEAIPEATLHKIENALLTSINSGEAALVRRRALEALGWSSRPEIPGLIEASYRENNTDWKVSALFAMGRSNDKHWGKHVLTNLRNRTGAIRLEAIRVSGELALTSARPVLLDMLADEEEAKTRREIIWSLSQIGGEDIREQLEELLEREKNAEEAEFIEEALENLVFAETISGEAEFGIFDFVENHEE